METRFPFRFGFRTVTCIALGLLAPLLPGCGTARVSSRPGHEAAPAAKPAVIHVADFTVEPSRFESGGSLPAPKMPSGGPLGGLLPPPPGAPKETATLGRELVNSMSKSLVRELTKAGLKARRLGPTEPAPAEGWLVSGSFVEVDQGDQIERTMVGFGAGQTRLEVLVSVRDLGRAGGEAFRELNGSADSGKAPGVGPMIVLGPAGAAARFVMAGQDLDRNVSQTAAKIAEELVRSTGTAP